ncbi:carbohydrate ABC transporter permease [Pseudonocardia xinjiangensis]|uniref:carbohydrate ABC transporter permease n=1 Tax=Pseudonocardia xinjiangensis TaxID=75289 RepID=UPI003D8D3E72
MTATATAGPVRERPADAPTPRRRGPRPTAGGVVLTALALLMAAAWLVPLLWALSTSVKPEEETRAIPPEWFASRVTGEAYGEAFGNSGLIRWFLNSTLVSVSVTLGVLVLCSLAAYGFSRTEFRGRRWLFAPVVAAIIVPSQVLIIPLFDELDALGLVDTYWAIILPQLVAPAMVFILKKFFDAIPREYEEAAEIDGASRLRVFLTIVIPMSLPVLSAVGIFTFITTWNNFLLPFVVTTDPDLMTLPLGLLAGQTTFQLQYAQVMALALLGGLPLLIIYVLFQRQVIRGVGSAGLKE